MKNMSNKYKIIPIICISIVVIMVILMSNNESYNVNMNLVELQKNQITQFFKKNKDELNYIKDKMLECDYLIKGVENDGTIILENGSLIWLPDISPNIKMIFECAPIELRNITLWKTQGVRALSIEFFFSENDIEIDLFYSQKNLTKEDSMYSIIDDNWYLFVAGMT